MILEHVAIWTDKLDELKEYYLKYFDAISKRKVYKSKEPVSKLFSELPIRRRLEIMSMPAIPDNKNGTITAQHKGIIHLAFGVDTIWDVEQKAMQLRADGFTILRGPRKTGDGYYEFETLDPDNNRLEVTCTWSDPE